jgi:Mrp family chromosome partitioning ATPase
MILKCAQKKMLIDIFMKGINIMDQAAKLRKLVREKKKRKLQKVESKKTAKILSVTSGKGGVGKTSLSVNIAAYLGQKMELRVLTNRCRFRII